MWADTTEIVGAFIVAGTVAARTASGSDSGPSPWIFLPMILKLYVTPLEMPV